MQTNNKTKVECINVQKKAAKSGDTEHVIVRCKVVTAGWHHNHLSNNNDELFLLALFIVHLHRVVFLQQLMATAAFNTFNSAAAVKTCS